MNSKNCIPSIIMAIVIALMAVTATGRELTLRELTSDPMDLDARAGKGVRLDAVGNKCALLKVELPVRGAVFEGNVMGEVQYLGNTHWVYVAQGTRQLRIKLDGYLTLRVDLTKVSSPEGVKSGFVYNIVVTGYEDSPAGQTSPSKQQTSSPVTQTEEPTFANGKIIPYTVKGVTFNMVGVEGGTFQMGSDSSDSEADDDEKPRHTVTVKNFQVGQTEVTQGLWKAVMGSNPSNFSKGDNYPVEQVSWEDCQTFLRTLNDLTGKKFRLLTEAEWEYAARGGRNSKGYKYSGSNNVSAVAWYEDNSGNTTHSVGTKKANELGIYDMTGNVWEWCQDWKGSYPNHEPSSGSSRVFRGGSWDGNSRNCRVAYRVNYAPSDRGNRLGLRLAL